MTRLTLATLTVLGIGLAFLMPGFASAAYNNITFPSGTSVVMTGTSNLTFSISAGATMNNMVVGTTTIQFILQKDAGGTSSVTITSTNGYTLANNGGVTQTCSGNTSQLTLTGPTSTGTTTIILTPSLTAFCPVATTTPTPTPAAVAAPVSSGTGGHARLGVSQTQSTVSPPVIPPTPQPSTTPSPSLTIVPPSCQGVSFTRNLRKDMSGKDVKCLQILLNQNPATQIATSGVGSPGNETTLFGAKTLIAVQKWQKLQGFLPAAQVGASSRGKLNSLLGK
jgi:hypothetical protein